MGEYDCTRIAENGQPLIVTIIIIVEVLALFYKFILLTQASIDGKLLFLFSFNICLGMTWGPGMRMHLSDKELQGLKTSHRILHKFGPSGNNFKYRQ